MKIYKYLFFYTFLLIYPIVHLSFSPKTLDIQAIETLQEDPQYLSDKIYKESIRSVRMIREGWELSHPIVDTKDQLPLVLTFDDLSDEPITYSYTLVHCDANWRPTDIIKNDYLEGMHQEIIRDYEFSRNTLQTYIHYSLAIPNQDMRPTLPGNYIIKVFEDYDEEQLVLANRFCLVDHRITINGEAKRTNNLMFFDTHHEVDFTLSLNGLRLDDPSRNIQVVVVQNFDFSTAIFDLLPSFTSLDELVYNYEEGNLFPGLGEWRHFDTKNLKYITEGIDFIRFERPLNHVYLLPDESRSNSDYLYEEDLNGKYFIKWDEGWDADTDADYIKVHFSLPFDAPINSGGIYLFGDFSGWGADARYEMQYNFDRHQYELAALLKQGYYNYQYRLISPGLQTDPTFFEGSFYETENDYLVFVYYHDFSDRYQQLIGFEQFNSVKKIHP